MVDKDGFERPDKADGHILPIEHETRKVKFDDKYSYRPRNIFFRMWAAFFRAAAITVFNPYMVLSHHMYTFGWDNRKKMKGKGFVMTCNHVHMLDDLSIGTNLFCWRKIYYTTLSRNIKRPMIGFFLRSLGGIPIPAGSLSGMKKFNSDIGEVLKSNRPVLFNPEASLWPYYRDIRPFKRGAFSTAVKNDVPVLPIVVLFKRKKKRNGKWKYKLNFAICEPVEIDKTLPDEKSQSEKMMKQVYETTKRVAKEWYEIQDCGFGDEKYSRVLRPGRDLFFEKDQWIVVDEKKKKSK
ncbi:MAG: 1-acyl-sn-glycerol-3-phosphate acyltransferase [Clostridia bacterium]|nr:1-acyl-sn-glycerol-3-phosphate acyltransferase [Clostridia bacterium]